MSDQREAFIERAAIIQFFSGFPSMTREESERIAAEQMGLTDDEAEFLMGSDRSGRHGVEDGVQKARKYG